MERGAEVNLRRLEQGVPLLWRDALCGMIKLWKMTDERGFLREAHSQVLQQKLNDLTNAFSDAFDPSQPHKRLPRFKRKGVDDRFRYPQGFKLARGRIYLPKVGWVGYFDSRPIEGRAKNATISFEGGHWYVSVQTERAVEAPVHPSTRVEGIDLGIAAFAATAGGAWVAPINVARRYFKKLARLQRKLARQVKFSSNWKNTKARINRLHHKIACIRADYLHKLSTALSNSHAMIAVEGLRIANMSASAKGTTEAPGKGVRQKAGLNRSILDQGWGEFRRQLDYKLARRGGLLVRVAPAYTSQRCSRCGHTDTDNRPSQAVFECTVCRLSINADVNAARNILMAALESFGLNAAEARRFVETHAARGRRAVKPVEGKGVGLPVKQAPWETPLGGVDNTTTGSALNA